LWGGGGGFFLGGRAGGRVVLHIKYTYVSIRQHMSAYMERGEGEWEFLS
jgi:hypothetical protein